MYILHKELNKIVYEYLGRVLIFLKRHKCDYPKASDNKHFWALSFPNERVSVLLNYPHINFKKTVCPKIV